MEDNDDDYFSDDFDAFPPGTLYQLEQNAFQATQAPATQWQAQPSLRDEAGAAPPVQTSTSLKPPPRLHTGLTNDYDTMEMGELEAEVHDNLERPVALPPVGHFPIARTGRSANVDMGDAMDLDDDGSGHVNDMSVNLQQLKEEKEQMRRQLAEAKALAETKAGEIAIIRSKQTRMIEEYDRQLATLRKNMAEEASKHKKEIEAATSEGNVLATANVFLQHDLAEEARQLRNYRTKQRVEEKAPPVTPKKSRILPFRDGFDDDEMAVVSPSKTAARSKRATPTVPGKRKRQPSQDSPLPLQLSPAGRELLMADATVGDAGTLLDAERDSMKAHARDQRLTKQLLNHRPLPDGETDLEMLSKLSFPSEPNRSLSSILMDQLARLDLGSPVVEYIYAIGPLWQRALTERLYEPVPRFSSITRCVLMISDVPLHDLIPPLVGVLQDTVEVNAVPRFRYSPAAREKNRLARQTPQSDLEPRVSSTEALSLLYQIACELLHVRGALESFWRHIRHTFILLMLHGSQLLKDITILLQLLSTSIRSDSFGPVLSNPQDQTNVQRWIVDRLTHMLSESAQPDEDMEAYTAYDICAMRVEVLSLLEVLTFSPTTPSRNHGSNILADHPNALPRLFRCMHDELDALYSFPPERDLRVSLVNGLMRLIFGVMRRHGSNISLQNKLACVSGSKQKHLVVLTRLAFCDGSILEAGIDDDTVDMAHELLEEWTNPQEADLLAEAFPSSRRD